MRLGGYIRVSKVGGREGDTFLSPVLQREKIEAWASAHGHDVVDVREDLDVSGGRIDRERLEQLVERVEAGELDGLVVATLDRFGRSLPYAIALIDRIHKAGGQFVSVADGFDTRTPYGELALNVMLSVAQFELRRIREQWRAIVKRQIDDGRHPGGQTPFGYARGANKRLVPDDHADTVREVFRRYAAGESLSSLSRDLTTRGVRTQRGALPTRRFLMGVLQNRTYLGIARSGDLEKRGAHDALVDEVTFRRCQNGFRPRPSRSGQPAELSGLVRCQGCGYVMSRVMREGRYRYRCLGNQEGRTCPAPAFVTEHELVPVVHTAMFDRLDTIAAQAVHDTTDSDQLRADLEVAEAELRVFRDEPGIIAALGAAKYTEGLEERRRRVDEILRALDAVEAARPDGVPDAMTLRAAWDHMDPQTRNAIVGSVFDAVVVRKHPSRSLRLPIHDRTRLVAKGGLATVRPEGVGVRAFDWPDDPTDPWVLPQQPALEDR